jgi:hypothetical protein
VPVVFKRGSALGPEPVEKKSITSAARQPESSALTFEQKMITACVVLSVAMLYFLLSYMEQRRLAIDVCTYLQQQVAVLPDGATSHEAPYGMQEIFSKCLRAKAVAPR